MESFKSSGIFTKQAHVKIPDGLFEEEHGRKGFFGRVGHLYHENPPVNWTDIDGELKPRCLPPSFEGKSMTNIFIPFLKNDDVVLNMGYYNRSFQYFFRNADYDELYFIHKGTGCFETTYGRMDFIKGDYIVIPRGTTYKMFVNDPVSIYKIESRSEFEDPARGLLGPNALYDQTAITTPKAQKGSDTDPKTFKIQIKRLEKITTVTYPFNPLDVKGWKGSVYPRKLSIYDYCPVMSHRYHIPPSGHTTFVCHNFVVCSFVERPLEDSAHGVLKVPFYHSNIDYDEVLFYHQGDFFSRDNIDAGSLTFHPQGIHHGPHPKAYDASKDKLHTDEYAVMVDTRRPLQPTKWFEDNEVRDYWRSWMKD